MDTPPATLHGSRVTLRPATPADRRAIWQWLARSDATPAMLGPPTYPDLPPPSWDEFLADYLPHYFDDSAPERGRCFVIEVDGEAVGQVNYNEIDEVGGVRRTELDIWLRSEADTGRGWGADALAALCGWLARDLGVRQAMVQPSARNPRAIRAYEKAGFVRASAEVAASWPERDAVDSVVMVRALEPEGSG